MTKIVKDEMPTGNQTGAIHGNNHPGPEVNIVKFSINQPGHPSLQRRGKCRDY